MQNRKVRWVLALTTIAAFLGLALTAGQGAASASTHMPAATINGPAWTNIESGYEIQSPAIFNQERATVCAAPGATTSPGLGLQDTVNGGMTIVLAEVFEPAGLNSGPPGFYLEAGQAIETNHVTGTPLANFTTLAGLKAQFSLHQVATLGAPIGTPLFTNITGGCYYLEVRESTHLHLVNLVAGPNENDAATLATVFGGIFTQFNAPFIGALNATGSALPVSHAEVTVTRNGITQPSGHGLGGTRVTFDAFPLDETEATNTGGMPTIGNPITLKNSPALPGVGSGFGITTGP
jgi:hypothetical protein